MGSKAYDKYCAEMELEYLKEEAERLSEDGPLLCDICREHKPLYSRFMGQQIVCKECAELTQEV